MKKSTILIVCCFFTFILNTQAQNIYEEALTAASYALKHTKEAHDTNNVFHLKEYASKAIRAFRKAERYMLKCDCREAYVLAYQARKDMQRLVRQDTYERGRFFAKRARLTGSQLLEEITKYEAIAFGYSSAH